MSAMWNFIINWEYDVSKLTLFMKPIVNRGLFHFQGNIPLPSVQQATEQSGYQVPVCLLIRNVISEST